MHWGARDLGQFPHCYTFSTCNSFQGLLCKEILKNQYLGLTSKVLWKYLILASTENISVTNSYLIQHSDQFSVQLHAQSYAQNVSREHSPGVDVAASIVFVRIFHNFQSTSAPGSNSVSSTVFSLLWVVSSMEPSARSDLARFICFLCRDWCKNIDQLEKLLSGLLISILQIFLVIYPYPSLSGSHSWSNIVCVLLVCFSNDQEYFLADEGK